MQNIISEKVRERTGKSPSRIEPTARIFMLAGVLALATGGCTTYIVQREPPPADVVVEPVPAPAPAPVVVVPSPPVHVEPPPVEPEVAVVIHVESDFYVPLNPLGRWVYIEPYGRCWIPARVEMNWRPYCNGHWELTERGWYWDSDEPWAWATYHYGRWDWRTDFGWFWVPQVEWAPAWVSWHRSDAYVGWAPLQPAARFNSSGIVVVNERVIPPRAFVFVEEKRFLEPVRPTTVVNNTTTIINKTVNITNVKVVNNTIINEGPRTEVIERASGRPVQTVAARELRRRTERPVVVNRPVSAAQPVVENRDQPAPVTRTEPARRESKPVNAPETVRTDKPAPEVVRTRPPAVEKKPEARPAPVRETQPSPVARTTEPVRREPKPVNAPESVRTDKPAPEVARTTPPAATRNAEQPPRRAEPVNSPATLNRPATPASQGRPVESEVKRPAPRQSRPELARTAAPEVNAGKPLNPVQIQREPIKPGQRVAELQPKHDRVAREQGRTNVVNKAHGKAEEARGER